MSGPTRTGPHPGKLLAVEVTHDYPARPLNPRWRHLDACAKATVLVGAPTHAYQFGNLRVLSSAIVADYHGQAVPQNHVTVSVRDPGRRPTASELSIVRHDFDMVSAEEDNHSPGMIRNLFLPLHLPPGTVSVCECKLDEEQVVEADGHVWSRIRKP